MSSKDVYLERISGLRKLMQQNGIDMYLIVSDDFHASEYVGDYFKCREYLTGFDGSAGTVVVSLDEICLWTDGRYFIQAASQLEGTGIILQKLGVDGVPTVSEYIYEKLVDGSCLAYDGRTVSFSYAEAIRNKLKDKKIKYIENIDLIGEIWEDRPELPAEPVFILEDKYSGQSRAQKLSAVRSAMKEKGADKLLLSSLDDIAWLYNIRGNDIEYNPVALAYTIISGTDSVLYINPESFADDIIINELQADGVILAPYLQVYNDVVGLHDVNVMLDKTTVNVALVTSLNDDVCIIDEPNPTRTLKAVKNPVEMDNERRAHLLDGVAVTKLIYWLKQAFCPTEAGGYSDSNITEMDVCERLELLRKKGDGYIEQSFAPIAAYAEHGAIVHYEPTEETDKRLGNSNFLLLDTGGQYLWGTTDVTRTISLGELTTRQKEHYTAVLRGNINLAAAHFKYGCTGANLDYLARAPLWELGLDYNHGSGHGVGYMLNVHEGPNAFRLKDADGKIGTVFEEGMITSDEPGLYIEGEYGIRLENLVLCRKAGRTEYGQFMEFETLTLVPFDRAAILPELMSERELALLDEYNARVYEKLLPYLTVEEAEWLKVETAPFL